MRYPVVWSRWGGEQAGLLPHAQGRGAHPQVSGDLADAQVTGGWSGGVLGVVGDGGQGLAGLVQGLPVSVQVGVGGVDELQGAVGVLCEYGVHDLAGGVTAEGRVQGPVGEQGAAVVVGEDAVAGGGAWGGW